VAQTFFVEPELSELFYLDGIITWVDCSNTPVHLKEEREEGVENEAVEQVAFADVLVLNNTDLVNDEQKKKLKEELKKINATAKMIETQQSRVKLDDVLGIKAFNLEKTLEMDDQFLNTDEEHRHDKTISSVGFVMEGSFFAEKFDEWIQKFLKEKAQDVFRSKGIFSIVGSDQKYVFQAVHMLFNMGSSAQMGLDLEPWKEGEKRVNKLCFIGRNLDRKELYDSLKACIHDGKEVDPGKPPEVELRFKVGDKVECMMGSWEKGTIVKLWYRDAYWPTGKFAPYQVKLDSADDDGSGLIYVPKDDPKLCRKPKVKGKKKKQKK
jgi:G3E family GTPase